MKKVPANFNPNFSHSLWVEIYNLLDESHPIRRKMPADDAKLERVGLEDSVILSFTHSDWSDVVTAAESKLDCPSVMGRDETARRWRRDLREIIATLDQFRHCEMCGALSGEKHHDPARGFEDRIVTLHRSAAGHIAFKTDPTVKRLLCIQCFEGARACDRDAKRKSPLSWTDARSFAQ